MGNLASSVRAAFEPLRTLDWDIVGFGYEAVGLPFANPVRILKVTNLTDEPLLVSFNGVDDHDIVAANGFFLYDFGTNKSDSGGLLEQSQSTRLYVKAATNVPDTGAVYVTIIYASQV